MRHIYATEARDTIYFCGAISFTGQSWQQSNSVMRYTQGQWDTLGVLNSLVYSVVHYNDTLIAGGSFWEASGNPCENIAYHNGSEWQPFGTINGTVRMLRVLDGELYAVGTFNAVDGQPASCVAKRVGGHWEPIGIMDAETVLDVIKYDGNLIVIGNVDFPNGRRIAEWDGNEWHLLGPGIINGFSGAQCLAVYQGDLYVGGQIALAPGNPGQNIMRWDGTQFHALGQGIQWWLGDQSSIATVFEMIEHDGKLFVGGGYRAAGGIEALGLSTWDGIEWCAVPGDFRAANGVYTMGFYQDTLFAACGTVFEGDTVNGLVRFVGEEYTAECSGPVDVPEVQCHSAFSIHPNPAIDQVAIRTDARTDVVAHDALGRTVWSGRVAGSTTIDVAGWAPGSYVMRHASDATKLVIAR